ncbi:DegV family protein [Clostridium sp. D2Q-14]|uniref:DegV family protein n=1 Tax=Anaeromonas gelatinilytica TaxID=2683194 RepID=UPI00193C4707|nr:DegV family protein [Anaeromonas gelatinilytica]MBS4534290.1 DegV family protein [Anaeromonas gelatinilytica]
MNNIQLITDSTCDLPKSILTSNNISVIPLYVVFNEGSFKDGIDITPKELYDKVDKTGIMPKTSAPTPSDFYHAFKPHVEKGKDIIYIGLSSDLSSTIQNAKIAASEFENTNIHVIDSKNLSSGIGLLILKASDLINLGKPLDEIVKEVKYDVSNVKSSFIIDTLDYLYKGGRCSGIQNLVGSIFKIKPILKLNDGKIIVGQKPRGKKQKALDIVLNNIYKNKNSINLNRIIIGDSFSPEDLIYLKEELEKNVSFKEIITMEAGCVISSHCGRKTVGIFYMEK